MQPVEGLAFLLRSERRTQADRQAFETVAIVLFVHGEKRLVRLGRKQAGP